MFDKFYGGLNTSLKTELKRFNITSLEAAIHLLSRIEDIHSKPKHDEAVAMDLSNMNHPIIEDESDDEHDLCYVKLSKY